MACACVCVCSPRTRAVAPQISRGAGTDGDDGYATRLHTANLIQGAEALLEQISAWEKQQAEAESEWRHKQTRMNAEFEERKRRLQEQQRWQR